MAGLLLSAVALGAGHPVAAAVAGAIAVALLRRALAWRRGATGEAAVSRALEAADLPGWAVNGVVLWRQQGDIDHVVLLPWGLFVLETKNGAAPPGPAAARQARRKAAALATYLARTGVHAPVQSLVVWTRGPNAQSLDSAVVLPEGLAENLRTPGIDRLYTSEIRELARHLLWRSQRTRSRGFYKSPPSPIPGR